MLKRLLQIFSFSHFSLTLTIDEKAATFNPWMLQSEKQDIYGENMKSLLQSGKAFKSTSYVYDQQQAGNVALC